MPDLPPPLRLPVAHPLLGAAEAVLLRADRPVDPVLAATVLQTVLDFPGWRGGDEALGAVARLLCLPALGPVPAPRTLALHSPTASATATGPWTPRRVEPKPWGWVDVIAETGQIEMVRLVLEPGGLLPNHIHRRMIEAEVVLDPGLEGWEDDAPAAPLAVGRVRRWRHGQPHGYRCTGPHPAGILCLDAPRFDPADEQILPRESPCRGS